MNIKSPMYMLAACALAACAGCRSVPPPPTPPPVYTVTVMAASPAAANLASGIATDIRGTLVQRGYPVALAAPQDNVTPVIDVNVAIDRRETAKLDVWRVYEGSAVARVIDMGALRGEKAFKATGKRADTEQDAEAGVRSLLSAELSAWLADVLPRTRRNN